MCDMPIEGRSMRSRASTGRTPKRVLPLDHFSLTPPTPLGHSAGGERTSYTKQVTPTGGGSGDKRNVVTVGD